MLEEVLRYVNNRFERSESYGEWSISDGEFEPGAIEGQYYWIEGSALNDGLHLHPADDLQDEEFHGKVVLLAVPNALKALATEISEWCEANAEAIGGPYQSESFGGYSYSMASGGTQGNELAPAAWQAHFGARLRPYRKLSRNWQ